jgi:ABC-2 type transport system ATP-binding protein
MIDIEKLAFGYGPQPLFQSMDMTLEPGNVYGLLGLNGAGKSTLLRLMTGLLFPVSGALRALGHDPAKREPSFLSKIFMLPEELHVPGVTDYEYVKSLAPFYPAFDHDRLARYLAELDVPRGRRLTSLSLGQKKKFLLAFGLACRPSLLVLDEPTNGLDIPAKGQFRRLVAESLTERQIFVISTHQVRDVESLIDPIVILHEGRVLFDRAMSEIASRVRMSYSAVRPGENEEGFLYCEPSTRGYCTLWKGAGGGRVDLEVFFNAVISRPQIHAALMGNGHG